MTLEVRGYGKRYGGLLAAVRSPFAEVQALPGSLLAAARTEETAFGSDSHLCVSGRSLSASSVGVPPF